MYDRLLPAHSRVIAIDLAGIDAKSCRLRSRGWSTSPSTMSRHAASPWGISEKWLRA